MRTILNSIKKKFIIIPLVLGITSFTVFNYVFNKNELILDILLGGLSQLHYSPVKLDDSFSEKVFDLYIKRTDASKKFFLQEDIDLLSKYKRSLDDQLKNQNHDFYKISVDLITKRIKEKESWYKEYLSQPLDYTSEESYESDYEKTKFAKTPEELKKEWQKMLKYQVLMRLDESLNRQETAIEKKDTSYKVKPFDSLEVDARRKVIKANNNLFKYYNKLTPKDRFALYANAITGIYDPHTEYFAPKEKKKFDQAMSGQFEGIGARLMRTEMGQLKVSEIIIGTPSYKQGELKQNDEIQKVAQGEGKPVDISEMEMDDAIELIKGKKGTEVRLTVKKPDGSIKVIPIIRDVIDMEDVLAKSAVLNNKSKIGYIYLPTFYTDFTGTGSGTHRCAKDMREEIEKLKRVGVKSIIIDLRDNGGGSLQEVVVMAGLFFPKGPVVQVKNRDGHIKIMEDYNQDVAWDGPLAIMVNHGSASASEILAAALQDYKRAVIIGTPTFGKGTVQSFLNLDGYLMPQFDTIKPIGEVKVTQQKFYRVSGGSTQLKGVTPNIMLPDIYAFIDRGERELEYPMPWDEISKASYSEFANINYDKLAKNSASRMKKNEQFKAVEERSKEFKSRKDESIVNLKLEKFRAEQKYWREQNKKYEEIKKDIKDFSANPLEEDISKLKTKGDTSHIGIANRWSKNVAKDIYIYEASNILNEIK
ncbi:MAG: carboxy terminal-processing peptidase [Sphingobacteriaceae bacterium]|nr:carboxy terminal-processing peptidase [Sphingobacteriaceae bacterium]